MSPPSPSFSDGEVSSGGEEKVIARKPRIPESSAVDPYHRRESSSRALHSHVHGARNHDAHSAAMSTNRHSGHGRQRSPYRARRRSRSRSRSPFRHDNADRSPSPWRPGKDAAREKRRFDDDHYGRSTSDSQRPKRRPDEASRDNERKHGGHGKRESTVSANQVAFVKSRDEGEEKSYNTNGSSERAAHREPPHSHRRDPHIVVPTGPHTSSKHNRHENGKRVLEGHESNHKLQTSTGKPPASTLVASSVKDKTSNFESHDPDETTGAKPMLSEAEQIELRRKRRAEIKAKVQADLRVAALENSAQHAGVPLDAAPLENVGTPQSPSDSAESVGTPRDAPTPGSPAEPAVITDEDLMNHHAPNTPNDDAGPSAADFDPNDAANEDRPDHLQQPAAASIEIQPADITLPNPTASKPKDDFDMFADDDDDMFAPKDTAPKEGVAGLQNASLMDNPDLPSGHYRVVLGEILNERYVVKQNIGQGTFAVVVRATDLQTGNLVAIKIACNNDTMLKAGRKEMDFVKLLNEQDPEDKKHIIRFLDQFTHRRHLCLVFENLNADLREILKKFGRNVGLDISAMRVFARQMFTALLHLKSVSVLHADLKPDNILVNDTQNSVKICDLGTATFTIDAELTPYLVSRFYRAPEVILGSEFSFGIDMWSIGCTLFELYCGRILFSGSTNNQMLRVMQECRGKLPNRMLKKAAMAPRHFDETYVFYSHEEDKVTKNMIARPIPTFVAAEKSGKDLKSKLRHLTDKMSRAQQMDHDAFVDLLDKCLQLDPERRIDPKKALMHHFFSRVGKPIPTKSSIHSSLAFMPSGK